MLKEIKGNLLDAKEGLIGHQVNCRGVMGAGVAKQIKDKLLPKDEFAKYQKVCNKDGFYLLGGIQILPISDTQKVINLFAEDKPTWKGVDTDYDALLAALSMLECYAMENNCSIALPGYLGCGLAGGDWEIVYNMIVKKLSNLDVTIYYIPESIKMLWNDFGNVQMDPETECIETEWHGFPAGTFREDIWHWFEDTFDICVATDLMFS